MEPVISVAIATYNGEKYILEQLESILSQTKEVSEIVITDDRSSDNTAEVIRSFISERGLDGLVSFSVNEKNLGYGSNFMRALNKTRGDFVFFCDQDDVWMPTRVRDMLNIMESNPEIGLLGSEFEPFKSSADAPDVPAWELRKFTDDGSVQKMVFNSHNIFIGCQGCTMLMRREFLEQIKNYWYEGWAHDEYVWKLALAMDKLYFYHKVTLKRRLHSGNVTLHKEHQKNKRLKYLKDLKKSHEKTLEYIVNCNGSNYRRNLLKRHIRATELRIELIEKGKLVNAFVLLGYLDCYHKKRSVPVELLMAVRG